MSLSRHRCREVLFQTIFAWEFRHELFLTDDFLTDVHYNLENSSDHEPEIPAFLQFMAEGLIKHVPHIREVIVQYAPEWPLDKINPVDRAILYIGVYELLFERDVPDVVAIDEAIELGKKFGNENTSKFVNGVLNAVMKNKDTLLEIYGSKT